MVLKHDKGTVKHVPHKATTSKRKQSWQKEFYSSWARLAPDWELEKHDNNCWWCWAVVVPTLMVRLWMTAWSLRTILSRTSPHGRIREGLSLGESFTRRFTAPGFPSSTSAMALGRSQPALSSLSYGCKLLSSLYPVTAQTSFGEKPESLRAVTTDARTSDSCSAEITSPSTTISASCQLSCCGQEGLLQTKVRQLAQHRRKSLETAGPEAGAT